MLYVRVEAGRVDHVARLADRVLDGHRFVDVADVADGEGGVLALSDGVPALPIALGGPVLADGQADRWRLDRGVAAARHVDREGRPRVAPLPPRGAELRVKEPGRAARRVGAVGWPHFPLRRQVHPHRLHGDRAVAAAREGVGDVHALVVHPRIHVYREPGPEVDGAAAVADEVLRVERDRELVIGEGAVLPIGGSRQIEIQREGDPARLRVGVVLVVHRLDGQRHRPGGLVAGMEPEVVVHRVVPVGIVQDVQVPVPVVVVGVDRPVGFARRGILVSRDRPPAVGQDLRPGQVVERRQMPLEVGELVHLGLGNRRADFVVGDHQAHRVRIAPAVHGIVHRQRPRQRAVGGVGAVVGDADVEVHARAARGDRGARRDSPRVA